MIRRSAHTIVAMSALTYNYEVYADNQMCVMAPKWPEQWQNAARLHEDGELYCVGALEALGWSKLSGQFFNVLR